MQVVLPIMNFMLVFYEQGGHNCNRVIGLQAEKGSNLLDKGKNCSISINKTHWLQSTNRRKKTVSLQDTEKQHTMYSL